jgi:pimeloyl-ACP methyl ester carboxylesterase
MNTLTKGLLTTAAAVTAWELGTRWWEAQRIIGKQDHWRNYYPPELVQHADQVRQSSSIVSTGVPLHIDAYVQPSGKAPVAVLYHGGGSYGRMATGLAMTLYDRGYTVVVGDRRGQGLSGGQRGMTTWSQDVQNAVDIARWAKEQFKQPLFLIGGSLGGPMSYYAAAAGAPAEAIACLNLYDWSPGSPDVAEIFGSTAAAARSAGALVGTLIWYQARLTWRLHIWIAPLVALLLPVFLFLPPGAYGERAFAALQIGERFAPLLGVLVFANLLSQEWEQSGADLWLARPVPRTGVLLARVLVRGHLGAAGAAAPLQCAVYQLRAVRLGRDAARLAAANPVPGRAGHDGRPADAQFGGGVSGIHRLLGL